MTTETKQVRRDPGLGVLLAAAVGAVPVGMLVALTGALVDGRPAALGAPVGAGLALTVLVTGSFVVHVVAHLMPSASLLVALLTYGLQLVGADRCAGIRSTAPAPSATRCGRGGWPPAWSR